MAAVLLPAPVRASGSAAAPDGPPYTAAHFDTTAVRGGFSALPEIRVVATPAHRDSSGNLRLPEVPVRGDRLSRRTAAGSATTVISRAEIASSGAVHLGEILRPVVGLRVASTGGVGAFTPLSIRGSSNDQVLVLIDGRRLNAAQGGGVDLSDVPLDNIERIEILRGGASALYGPDAIGGVLNLVTREVTEARAADLRAEVGSFGTRLIGGRAAGRAGNVDIALSGRFLASTGDYAYERVAGTKEARNNEEVTSGWGDLGLAFRPAFASRLNVRGGWFRAEKGVPGAAQFPSGSAVQTDERSAVDFEIRGLHSGRARGGISGPRLVTNVSGFVQRQIRWFQDPLFPLGAVDESHRNDAAGARIDQFRDLGAAGRLALAAEYRSDHLESTTDGVRDRAAASISMNHSVSWPAARLTLTPALRVDAVLDFPARGSPKLLAAFQPSGNLELRASAGSSFRPPSFSDLFLPARTSAAGNPNLRAEKSFDYDFGASWSVGSFRAGVTVFENRITDLIQWIPGAAGVWRPHNVTGARITGVETEAAMAVPLGGAAPALHLQANYTFLDPRDRSDEPNTGGRVLVYRPRHRLNLQARLPLGRWSAESQLRTTGPAYITRANTKSLPGYTTIDAVLRRRTGRDATVELRGLNLTNAEYQDIRDYPVPGRQWRLGMEWRFGG